MSMLGSRFLVLRCSRNSVFYDFFRKYAKVQRYVYICSFDNSNFRYYIIFSNIIDLDLSFFDVHTTDTVDYGQKEEYIRLIDSTDVLYNWFSNFDVKRIFTNAPNFYARRLNLRGVRING